MREPHVISLIQYGNLPLLDLAIELKKALSKDSNVDPQPILNAINIALETRPKGQLASELSAQRNDGLESMTFLYLWMTLVTNAVINDSVDMVEPLANIAMRFIEESQPDQLGNGVSDEKKSTEKKFMGTTALWMNMYALGAAAASGNSNVYIKVVADIAEKIIERCASDKLIAGVTAKAVEGKYSYNDTNGLYWLMRAFQEDTSAKNDAARKTIANLIFNLLAKLPSNKISAEEKALFYDQRVSLLSFLRDYLSSPVKIMSAEEFEKMCSAKTLLGDFIDYRYLGLGSGETDMRQFANGLLRTKRILENTTNELYRIMCFQLTIEKPNKMAVDKYVRETFIPQFLESYPQLKQLTPQIISNATKRFKSANLLDRQLDAGEYLDALLASLETPQNKSSVSMAGSFAMFQSPQNNQMQSDMILSPEELAKIVGGINPKSAF